MLDLTVAIPTYNGEKRLPEVLDKLRSQTGTGAIGWEVLVVDNNSSDGTAEVVRQYQQNWLSGVPLRYCLETQQGAAFARQKAVQESQAELIGFLDDDNVPKLNWVSEAVKFAREHPQAGAYGSQIHGIFEAEPPPHFERIKGFLAITERGSQPHLYAPKMKMLPPSAGLVVRRRAWLENVPPQMLLTGRVGGQMLASEDLEVLRYIQKAHWEVWYNPDMVIDHLIPRSRLEKDYLMKLCFGVGLSSHAIRMLKFPQWQRPFLAVAYLLNDIRKIVLHLFKYKLAVYTEIVAASEMQFLIGRFFSPFYFMIKPHQIT